MFFIRKLDFVTFLHLKHKNEIGSKLKLDFLDPKLQMIILTFKSSELSQY